MNSSVGIEQARGSLNEYFESECYIVCGNHDFLQLCDNLHGRALEESKCKTVFNTFKNFCDRLNKWKTVKYCLQIKKSQTVQNTN